MAQNITLLGANYPDVPAVTLPITGGGTATFSDTRSVTYNLSGGATASVTPSEVVTGQGFSVKLTAPTGYVLSGVTVTMGGNDITSQVFTPDEQGGGGGGTYVRTEILAQQTITPDSSQRRATLSGFTDGLTSGDYYVVTYDGTEWLLTCSVVYGNNYLVGDINYFYGSSDALPIPFGIIWVSGTTATLATYNTNQHTVKIEHLEFIEDGLTLGTKTITQNGTYNASSDSLDGFSNVTVNCSGGTPSLQTKSVSYTPTTSSQSAQVTADSGYDGLQQVNVSVGAIPSEYIVPSGTQTVTANGTFDVSALAEMVVNVASGGSSVKTGTVTPSTASTKITFDAGLSTITGILVMPINTPLTGSRTQAAMICLPNGSFYKAISIHTNSGGTGWVSPTVYTSDKFSISGTTVTVTGAYSFRPAVGYIWYAW